MAKTRLQIARKDIISLFEKREQNVYKRPEIEKILSENRDFWRLANSTSVKKFIEYLKEMENFQEFKMDFPHRTETRYVWGKSSNYDLIQSIRPSSYFSHFTAIFIHELTDQIPKTIYLNYEQPKKKISNGELSQDRIDMAFRNSCRVSKTIAHFRDKRICLLNGKHTAQKGVIDIDDEFGKKIKVTDIERTLIDSVVRPVYSGGVNTVLTAFERAAQKVSINKLVATLVSLEYTYPYHQAIGFYLEKAGNYSEEQIALIDRFPKNFNFYLTHQIKKMDFSERWKIYYPSGL